MKVKPIITSHTQITTDDIRNMLVKIHIKILRLIPIIKMKENIKLIIR